MIKIASIIGARPQFVKLAPLVSAAQDQKENIKHIIVHTGQHYDYDMSKVFFDELAIPDPDYHLEVGSGTHGYQVGEMLKLIETALVKEKPNWVLVYGDTNSTLAGALAAAKLQFPIAHIEAGLRSYDRRMPEEINRVLTDCMSSLLFCPTENAANNLRKENFTNIFNQGKMFDDDNFPSLSSKRFPIVINVGDIMYDAMLICLKIAETKSKILNRYNLLPRGYCLATIHRANNTDEPERLSHIIEAFTGIAEKKRVIWPIHPRTRKMLKTPIHSPNLLIVDPLSYFDMLVLEKNAEKIITDSGGVQKEAHWFDVPCITLREETEWVETTRAGRNVVAGVDKKRIIEEVNKILPNKAFQVSENLFGDGNAAGRILSTIKSFKS